MLTRLHLRAFKSWKDTKDISLRPITGFFGANSSGKTSLLQSLLLLKQTSDSSDRGIVFHFGDKITPVDLGDFNSVLHDHQQDSELGIAIDWKTRRPFEILDTKNDDLKVCSSDQLGFEVRARQVTVGRTTQPVVEEMSYRVGDISFGMRRRPKTKLEYDIFAEDTDFYFVRSVGRKWPLTGVVKC